MCVLLDTASGRGPVPGVEAVERARAERGELVDLFLLACALFLWSRCARFGVAGAGASRGTDARVTRYDRGSRRRCSRCETPAGEACATPASFVWRFQAALNAFWDLGRGADDKSGWFLAGSAALWTLDQLFALGL